MIKFPCTCDHPFTVPDDMAGGLIQCPRCGRLNDVPKLSDLASLDTDGTYKLDAPETPADPNRLEELRRVWSKNHVDEQGVEIDLRSSEVDYDLVGADQIPLDLKDEIRPGAPKYDPVTGELVRPLGVKKDDAPADIPMAKPVLGYASGVTMHGVRIGRAPIEVLMPSNLVVMVFIAIVHIMLGGLMFFVAIGGALLIVIPVFLGALLVSHYGNTVDEIGPEGHDELPRPLRNLGWQEDLWGPFSGVVVAMFLSYLPVLFVNYLQLPGGWNVALSAAAGLLGAVLFPAMALTALTSGSFLNLRPDRVFGVMRICGWWYVLAVVYWLIAAVAYAFGLWGGLFVLIGFALKTSVAKVWIMGFGFASMALAIYLMHLFCYHLGLLYRVYHDHFPWLYQRHETRRERTALSPEEKAEARADRQRREARRAQRQV